MKIKQITLVALVICIAGVCCFAQNFKIEINGDFLTKKGKADLIIREVKFDEKRANRLNVFIENKGNGTSRVSRLLLTVEGINKSLKFRQRETFVSRIKSGETRQVNISAPIFLPKNILLRSTDFRLKIDSNEDISESDETNNEFSYKAEDQGDSLSDKEDKSNQEMTEDAESIEEDMPEETENVDETMMDKSENKDNSTDEPENSAENEDDESENFEDVPSDESEVEDDAVEDEPEGLVDESSSETEDSVESNEEEMKENSSTKKKKVKALNDLIDNIQVLLKPSSKPKIKP